MWMYVFYFKIGNVSFVYLFYRGLFIKIKWDEMLDNIYKNMGIFNLGWFLFKVKIF